MVDSSSNTNKASSSGAQENKNCQENTGCVNFLSTGGLIGLQSNGFVETSGNNNSVEDQVNSIESSNDNNIKETADQENNYCTDTSFCFNLLGITSDIGVISGGDIANSGDNNSISNNLDIANSDNNNKIAQDGEQSNEHCSESSSCLNFGAVTADIGSLQGPDISNDDSNAKLVQSSSIKDTNNGNVISQKLDQNNKCREGSSSTNDGNLFADISGQNNQHVDQSMTQKNLCLKQSTCNSTGSVTGGSGSNAQSNLCVKNSECSNSGTNNKNICLDGSSCTNTGINTKVISKDSSCSSGVEGSTTICSNGRIISVGNNPEKNP